MSGRRFSFLLQAREYEKRPALQTPNRRYTYGELASRVALRAESFLSRGLEGRMPWVRAERTVETVADLLALTEIGVPFIPIHPAWTVSEVLKVVPAYSRPLHGVDASSPRAPDFPAGCLAGFCTSGTSSGVPKIALHTHSSLWAAVELHRRTLGAYRADCWWLQLPLSHVGGFAVLARCFATGSEVFLAPEQSFDAAHWTHSLSVYRPTLVSLVPTQLHRWLQELGGATLDERVANHRLRKVLIGGAALPDQLWEAAVAKRIPVATSFGMTETFGQVLLSQERPSLGLQAGPGVRTEILEEGELALSSPSLCAGFLDAAGIEYLQLPYRSGDLAVQDAAGRTRVIGRKGDVIHTGGEKVLPYEVEAALRRGAGVEEALVVGVPDPEWGQQVVAIYTSAGSDDVGRPETLRTGLEAQLASYKVPKHIFCVKSLPRNAMGKVDRRQAVQIAQERLR